MCYKLISPGPYLAILAHRFLNDRSRKPIPSWRTSSSSSAGCGRRRGGGASLPRFSPQAGRGWVTLGRDVFKNARSLTGVWQGRTCSVNQSKLLVHLKKQKNAINNL